MDENKSIKMKIVKIMITDRNYSSWSYCYPDTNMPATENDIPELKNINPIDYKLFSQDIIAIHDNEIKILKSNTKLSQAITGVLQLENNKTFGRTENKKRQYYKCIPDNKHLPVFLIPYEIKMGFSKLHKNKYVIFKFDDWKDKHPHGILVETLGNVDNLEVFYEYQLYCKSIYHSISDFTNKTKQVLNKKSTDEFVDQILQNSNYHIEDRRKEYVFTIDPQNSSDFDDGFSIQKTKEDHWRVTVYIANVYFWMETFGLWNSFSKRVSTIYLPDRRRPMLPNILSDTLCSLQENQLRFALAMDFIIDSDGKIVNTSIHQYKNVLICVKKNYVYEDPTMLVKDVSYSQLFDLSLKMDENIQDSNDLVSHWMITMNMYTGMNMEMEKIGIFRTAHYVNSTNRNNIQPDLDLETIRVIRSWNNITGQYIAFNETINFSHEIMQMKSYTHVTSPIRRLVDLLNQILMMKHFHLVNNISSDAEEFLKNWMNQMDYINTSMRSIRKIQIDCTLLNRCYNDTEIMKKEYQGVLFDKIKKEDGMYKYMVYLKDLNLLSRITCSMDLKNYSHQSFKIYLFEDEDKTKKKIRLHMKHQFDVE